MSTIDLTPSPRVLRMLGQIDFQPWQCLAELIDNSVDAFLDGKTGRKPRTLDPRVAIELPSLPDLDAARGSVTVADNGPGMTEAELALAVKAGYSGNDPVEKLGLFGMGFNIATARLGRRTIVRSTTADSDHWIEVEIDFDSLERSRTFMAPVHRHAKSPSDIENGKHGTEVVVQKLEPHRIRPLIKGRGKASTRNRLGKIYGRVMTQLGIEMLYGGESLKPRLHCCWASNRSVPTKSFGNVPAIIEIHEVLDAGRFCNTCWVWLTTIDKTCPSCGSAENVVARKRQIDGWIGIQRYFHKEHYGIDLIRNGRVIEELDKSLFYWTEEESCERQLEYPVDTTHWGGRIVGELEIDFVRVSHQKDAFDKLDPEWSRIVELVRGTSPLRPQVAARHQLPVNTSSLAKLYSAYRTGNEPGLATLVPGRGGKGVNDAILDWVDKFYEGDPDYQTDEKWFELVLEAEQAKRGAGTSAEKKAAGGLPIRGATEHLSSEDAGSGAATENGTAAGQVSDGNTTYAPEGVAPARGAHPVLAPAPSVPRVEEKSLTGTYELEALPGSPRMNVVAYRVYGGADGRPLSFRASSQEVEFCFNPDDPFFEQSLTTPRDCLVRDLAARFILLAGTTQDAFPVAIVESMLLTKYFPQALTLVPQAVQDARDVLKGLRQHLVEMVPSKAPIDRSAIPAEELAKVRKTLVSQGGGSEAEVVTAVESGTFVASVSTGHLLDLVRRWPDLVMDGRLLSNSYAHVSAELQKESVEVVLQTYRDVLWLCSDGGGDAINKDERWRLRYARALASLRLLQSWMV